MFATIAPLVQQPDLRLKLLVMQLPRLVPHCQVR